MTTGPTLYGDWCIFPKCNRKQLRGRIHSGENHVGSDRIKFDNSCKCHRCLSNKFRCCFMSLSVDCCWPLGTAWVIMQGEGGPRRKYSYLKWINKRDKPWAVTCGWWVNKYTTNASLQTLEWTWWEMGTCYYTFIFDCVNIMLNSSAKQCTWGTEPNSTWSKSINTDENRNGCAPLTKKEKQLLYTWNSDMLWSL